ncbi:hypothetical protein NHX12_012454 [Muraenolepis orangiensis]|uniref:Uncharacterized protein n=1 Tax=Muraenolepis orangiensis TaxID=630683 RepID=A0A9Q0DED2_9TELE|nr:hypothetical protein NHX12_012454 [Muraenolepis orangiensis]
MGGGACRHRDGVHGASQAGGRTTDSWKGSEAGRARDDFLWRLIANQRERERENQEGVKSDGIEKVEEKHGGQELGEPMRDNQRAGRANERQPESWESQ